jgi:hypothetical protein
MLYSSKTSRAGYVIALFTEAVGVTDESVHPDVLIIGGGVMGLWLLNDLRQAGYQACSWREEN